MRQSLNLRLGQQLTMTPQLQQAIKLLQMSTLELQQEIQQALESNIMLEINDDESSQPVINSSPEKKTEHSDSLTSEGSQSNIPDELPIDSTWDDIYEGSLTPGTNNFETGEFEPQRSKASTLLDHLTLAA
jgi:DNA-directed RNA polymerase specialized sigma subunit, sigma54 homolog